MYILIGLVMIAAGGWLFKYELSNFRKKDAPTALKFVEAIILSFFWIAVPLILLGILVVGQGIRDLMQ